MGRHKPLPPPRVFAGRLLANGAWVTAFILAALGIGVVGYRVFLDLSWVDALLNASMILTGMGPVDPPKTTAGKLFASGYALFSGVFFLSATAFLLAPVAQHFLHRFHLEMAADDAEPVRPAAGGASAKPEAKRSDVAKTDAKKADVAAADPTTTGVKKTEAKASATSGPKKSAH